MRKLLDKNCNVNTFAVVVGGVQGGKDREATPPHIDTYAPDHESAAAHAVRIAPRYVNRDIYIMQIVGQLRAVPHIFEIGPNEEPPAVLSAPLSV